MVDTKLAIWQNVAVVTIVSMIAISRVRSVQYTHTHTQKKKNLGDSLPYLNALVTPESLVCTCLE